MRSSSVRVACPRSASGWVLSPGRPPPVRNYRDYKRTDFEAAEAELVVGVNRGILTLRGSMSSGLCRWPTPADMGLLVGAFEDLAKALRAWGQRIPAAVTVLLDAAGIREIIASWRAGAPLTPDARGLPSLSSRCLDLFVGPDGDDDVVMGSSPRPVTDCCERRRPRACTRANRRAPSPSCRRAARADEPSMSIPRAHDLREHELHIVVVHRNIGKSVTWGCIANAADRFPPIRCGLTTRLLPRQQLLLGVVDPAAGDDHGSGFNVRAVRVTKGDSASVLRVATRSRHARSARLSTSSRLASPTTKGRGSLRFVLIALHHQRSLARTCSVAGLPPSRPVPATDDGVMIECFDLLLHPASLPFVADPALDDEPQQQGQV